MTTTATPPTRRTLTARQKDRLSSLTRRIAEARARADALTAERLELARELWDSGVSMPEITEACGLHNWSLQRALIRKYGDEYRRRSRWGTDEV